MGFYVKISMTHQCMNFHFITCKTEVSCHMITNWVKPIWNKDRRYWLTDMIDEKLYAKHTLITGSLNQEVKCKLSQSRLNISNHNGCSGKYIYPHPYFRQKTQDTKHAVMPCTHCETLTSSSIYPPEDTLLYYIRCIIYCCNQYKIKFISLLLLFLGHFKKF